LTEKAFIGAVFRLGRVKIPREALEVALGMPVSHYGRHRTGDDFFAHIDVPETGNLWDRVLSLCERLGTKAISLIETGAVSNVDLDIGYSFYESNVSAWASIPSKVAEAVGRVGVNIMVTFYLTSTSEQPISHET